MGTRSWLTIGFNIERRTLRLCLEREPQNVPGTLDPERNWCRRAAVSLDDLVADKNLAARLEQLVRALEASTDGETTEARPQEGGD